MAVAEQVVARSPGASTTSDGKIERERLRMMILIRRFEERTYQEYTKPGQRIGGFCHLYSGQEAVAVGIASVFEKGRDLREWMSWPPPTLLMTFSVFCSLRGLQDSAELRRGWSHPSLACGAGR